MAHKPWPLDEPLPALLTPGQLMSVLQLKHSRFCALAKAGKFRFLEVSRPLGRAKYSGELVRRYIAGESTVRLGAGARKAS